MKAIVLVGGYGTRMYPLSFSLPKALLPIANNAFVDYVINWLGKQDVSEIILSMYHMPNHLQEYIEGMVGKIDTKIKFSVEPSPLGSGGALLYNKKYVDDTFILLNGDILTDMSIRELVNFHKSNGAKITATLNEVDDPRHWGIVELDSQDRALSWQEKPAPEEARSNWGNVGVWIFEPEIIDTIPAGRPVSLEKEIFPKLIAEGVPFYGYKYRGYWKDIGTPDKYHQANRDALNKTLSNVLHENKNTKVDDSVFVGSSASLDNSVKFFGPVVIGENCQIEKNVVIKGPVVIGNHCKISEGCEISDSVIWDNVILGKGVVAQRAIIGHRTIIEESCYLGEGAVISPDCHIGVSLSKGTRIGPGSSLPKST
jgi:mannose-1-phosphate guanylyltransferase